MGDRFWNLVSEKTIIKNIMNTIPMCVGFPGFLQTSSNHAKYKNKIHAGYIEFVFPEAF